MKVGARVCDALFNPDSGINRGTGTIIEIEELEGPPKGVYSVIVKWDKPIPEGNPMGLTEDTSDDYLDDLILLENEEDTAYLKKNLFESLKVPKEFLKENEE